MTINVLDLVKRGSTYQIRQENAALNEIYPSSPSFPGGVKTQTYNHSDLTDGYAVIVKAGGTVTLAVTSYDAKGNIIETVYVDVNATDLTFKNA